MIKIKNLEKRLWKFNFQTGIFDITMGLILIITALCQRFSGQRFYLYLLYSIPVFLSRFLNRKLIIPRSGVVNFNQKPGSSTKRTIIISIFVVVVALVLILRGDLMPVKDTSGYIILGFIFGITALTAFYFELLRLLVYGIVITGGFLASEYLVFATKKIDSGAVAWLAAGLIITICGLGFLIYFLQNTEKN